MAQTEKRYHGSSDGEWSMPKISDYDRDLERAHARHHDGDDVVALGPDRSPAGTDGRDVPDMSVS